MINGVHSGGDARNWGGSQSRKREDVGTDEACRGSTVEQEGGIMPS